MFGISLEIRRLRLRFPASSLPRSRLSPRRRHAGRDCMTAFGGICCTGFHSASSISSKRTALKSSQWLTIGENLGTGSSDELRAL